MNTPQFQAVIGQAKTAQVIDLCQRLQARRQREMNIDRLFDQVVRSRELRHCRIAAIDHGIDAGLAALNAGASFQEAWRLMLEVARRPHGGAA